ncbi:MAG: hypothetical protein JOZ10_19015 [Acidobacteria bacterium]|nr:hypothetical protein [Acidobacteriota bacterium]MBV9146557.1 hypothetical protein [Acidobacteriota bacterium]
MSISNRIVLGSCVIALVACICILILLASGTAGVLILAGRLDLMYVLWPSSLMLVVGWGKTPFGIMITLLSVALNCALYTAIALGLYKIGAFLRTPRRSTPSVPDPNL